MALAEITDSTYKQETGSGLVLVDCWAEWCGLVGSGGVFCGKSGPDLVLRKTAGCADGGLAGLAVVRGVCGGGRSRFCIGL